MANRPMQERFRFYRVSGFKGVFQSCRVSGSSVPWFRVLGLRGLARV